MAAKRRSLGYVEWARGGSGRDSASCRGSRPLLARASLVYTFPEQLMSRVPWFHDSLDQELSLEMVPVCLGGVAGIMPPACFSELTQPSGAAQSSCAMLLRTGQLLPGRLALVINESLLIAHLARFPATVF